MYRGGGAFLSPKTNINTLDSILYSAKIAIIIPCYNEELTIGRVIDEIFEILPQSFVYVFDNNSSDSSYKIVETKIASMYDKSLYLYKVSTQGKGAVMREAFALIQADCYVMIDADTQYDVSALPSALNMFFTQKLDMLNIARESESHIYRPLHSFGNRLFSKSAQILFGTKISDMLSGYRIFSYAFVKSFPAHSNGFEIETELTIFALQQRLRTAEVKAPYKARPQGSFSKLSTFKDGFKISLMILNLLFTERPLFVFGILSALCLIVGIAFSVPVVMEFLETSKVARFPTLFVCVGLGIVSVVLLITGLLAYLITRSIREGRYLAYLNASRFFTTRCDEN